MNVTVFGATGRVGLAAVDLALERGHSVTAVVRDPAKLTRTHERLTVARGDVYKPETLPEPIRGADAVIVAVGGDVFKPSTLVTDSAKAILAAMATVGATRYVGISGVAQMHANALGAVVQAGLRLSPIKHAVDDHQGAFEAVRASSVDWALAGCPYIKDGPATGVYGVHPEPFPGGLHTIHPGDVGHFLVGEAEQHRYERAIVGIWY